MGEIFLDKALGLLSSDKQKERTDGLADLKHILQQNRHSAKSLNLNDKACHKIFDTLFRCITIEKTAFIRSQRSQTRKPSTVRISTCASVLRIAVDIFSRNLRAKTVRAIIEHIIETIPIPGEGLWEPLSVDYTKCLTSLLHYPPHLEHLGDAEWERIIDFCLATISIQESDESQLSIRSGHRSVHEDVPDASDSRSTPSRITPVPVARERYVGDRNAIGEVVVCIQLLTTCPSAPVQAAAENILQCLVEFVKSPSMMTGNTPQLAFSSINAVVSKVLFDQAGLVRSILLNLVPVIQRLWTTKFHNLKDELLVSMMFCVLILVDAAQKSPSSYLAQSIEGLANTLQSEYIKRSEKELLQVDEVVFSKATAAHKRPIYGPRLGIARSEHNWTFIWIIATLLKLAEDVAARVPSHEPARDVSAKRQRLTSGIEEVFRDALSATGTRRICALQLVPFLESDMDVERKVSFFQRLVPHIMDDNGVVSSWTMLALASFANTACAKLPSFNRVWPRVTELTTRTFSSIVTSRAACKLIDSIITAELLDFSDMTETARVIISSASLSGPATISDAALDLWALIAQKRTQLNSNIMQSAPKQICTWLREVWTVGAMANRTQMAQIAMFARPLDLLNLLLACTNRPVVPSSHLPAGPTGLVAKTWFFLHENCEISKYLFDIGTITADCDPWSREKTWALNSSTQQDHDDMVILEFLRSKSDIFVQTWTTMAEDKSQHITAEILQIYASFCIVSALYEACLPQESRQQVQDLRHNRQFLWNGLCDSLADYDINSMIPILELLSPVIPPIASAASGSVFWTALLPLISPLSSLLDRQNAGLQGTYALGDPMDIDDQMTSQGDHKSTDLAMLASNRESTPLISDNATFYRCMTLRVSILLRAHAEADVGGRIGSTLVAYLTHLNEDDLLSAQSILPEAYDHCSTMERDQLLQILEDLGEKCLQSYDMERCEAAHGLCIHMMTVFVASWTNSQSDDLNESAADLYNWCMEVLLKKKTASPKVYIALSKLVQNVLNVCPSYGSDNSLPSPRTSLFSILQEGDMQVKFSVAGFLPTLLGQFLLKDHDIIFDDVLESLPRDPDWVEGIALRLFALSRLASKWHTLLRRSMYHIFETPAQVPDSLAYTQKCTNFIFNALGLRDARQLFRLFAPQILYTWMETQNVFSMPFSIFGYGNIREMLVDIKDEITGQMIMRGKDSEIQEVAIAMKISHVELLKTAFHKAEAYSIARDISTPPEQGSQPQGVEVRLRKLLGAEEFMTQIESHFPQIIADFFKSLDRHDQIERAFSKRPNFRYAMDIESKIDRKTHVLNSLPASQQPSFRARYLLDEIEFLCNRTGFELEAIWTPTLVSFVSRSLLESIHPALGTLHTCSVIRKLKILVCIAGPVILRDYPYEMLLYALLPFIAELDCSADTLGIFLYLLEAGKQYLIKTPGFMGGMCVSALVNIRRLLWSSQESTQPGSHFNAVISDARTSYQWLCDFVRDCSSPDWSTETKSFLSRIFSLARKLLDSDNVSSGPVEKQLVFEVLKDRNSASSLLSKPLGDLVLSLLCPEFKRAANTVDISSDITMEPTHIASLWQTLHQFHGGVEYRLWAAQAIGRSFASTGQVDESLLREQEISLFAIPELSQEADAFCFSKASILEILCKKLPIHDNLEAGLIERTLQLILNSITEFPDFQPCADVVPEPLMKALLWNPYICPQISLSTSEIERCKRQDTSASRLSVNDWARNLSLFLINGALDDPVLGSLRKILNVVPGLAVQLLPYIVHDALLIEGDKYGQLRNSMSGIFNQTLLEAKAETMIQAKLVISCILYLRNQPVPNELTIVERDMWLEIDYSEASSAAHRCGLQKTSLLFLEIQASRVISGSRRSSVVKYEPPIDLLHNVFKNIDDPDLFYGIQQSSSLTTVMERLEYESSGLKNLLFQSAQYDSEIQMSDTANPFGVLKALNSTNLQGIANTMISASGVRKDVPVSFDSMLQAATSLQQWDIPVSPVESSPLVTVLRAFQSLNSQSSLLKVAECLDGCLLTTLNSIVDADGSAINLRRMMRALGFMTEMNDIIQSPSAKDLEIGWSQIMARSSWLKTESYNEVGEILSWHEALFSSIRKNDTLMPISDLTPAHSRLLEARVFRQSLEITRNHGVSQASLKSAISLSKLAEPCAELGLNIDGAAKFDLANVLWDQGEMTASIRMLQQLKRQGDLHKQAIPLSRAELLVTLGHHVAEARLEKPDTILQDYLSPAVKELKGVSDGETAARVYHGFATFCDQQLLNADGLEDFKRVEQLRDRKEKELLGLEDMMKTAEGRERESLRIFRAKAKQWFDLDDREYQRLLRSREAFLQQSLENYLLALRESDIYNNDSLRFCALWLDKSNSKIANAAVSRYLSEVPSHKFAPLMNQLSSRLLDVSDDFQSLLTGLVYKICVEHPFHGMYQIFASSKSKGGKDPSSHSRFRAANKLVDRLKNDNNIGPTWVAVHNMNITYVRFAVDKPDSKYKSGARIALKKVPTGDRLGQDAITYKLPPPTMKIELQVNKDYSRVPTVARFNPDFTIASGVSAPKIVTAIATNGVRYKQLYKGGNDDLRQDAIMEQVFEQVSSLLKDHQPTRQRNLGIRTYKVLPLTLNAGIIEFVPNTIPLHDFLMPAHQRYFPKDMKPSACRKHVADVQTRSFEQRVRTYRQVTEHFHPVMKYFFMEKFNNPDDWFSKRLSYTRSTAAISILGHVLGLGDRHGHNILLDEKTGEVVHIDLGVAFEQGRILPVPEVVPFRLTRDLVDGFGITKTEGVFRRCCEFTLEALRQESYSIMTILDVLRYDPLYSWTVSPLRMKKMQDNQDAGDGPPMLSGSTTDKSSTNEPSEADRALTVVAKKLSKTLSVTATVNELIQQATDEKNLAVLYCGWASYA